MGKGLVTKVEKNYILVMTDDMNIERVIKTKDYQIGDRISYMDDQIYRGFRNGSMRHLLMTFVVFISLVTSVVVYAAQGEDKRVYATVSVDINPSLDLDINGDFLVNNFRAYNEEAMGLNLEEVEGRPIHEALELIIAAAEEQSYLVEDETLLIASTTYDMIPEALELNIESVIDEYDETYHIAYVSVEEDSVENTEEREISLGRSFVQSTLALEDEEATVIAVEAIVEAVSELPENVEEVKVLPEALDTLNEEATNDEPETESDTDSDDESEEEDDDKTNNGNHYGNDK